MEKQQVLHILRVCALIIQHAKHVQHVLLSSVASLVLQHFSTLFHVTEHKVCVLSCSTCFVTNIAHSKKD
jgi:hypothetical protein